MRIRCLIRATKYQLLGISIIVLGLGIAVAAVTLWTCFSDDLIVIHNITIETNRYTRFHDLAVYTGLSSSIFLALLGIICLIGIVKESEYLLSVVLFCFAVLFCGVVQLVYWRPTYEQLVENAVKDVYDFLYDDYLRNISSSSRQDLIAIHSADCLQAVENRITGLMTTIGALTLLVGIVTVYGMILIAFFCFAGCLTEVWYKKGKYSVASSSEHQS